MNKMISAASAATLLAMGTFAGIAPASAAPMGQYQQQDRYIGNFCANNPNASQCNDWKTNHSNWNNDQYQSFYRSHQNDNGFGGAAIAGLFGLAIGSTLAHASTSSSHVAACENAYHSYNVQSDSYLGFDGDRHLCRI